MEPKLNIRQYEGSSGFLEICDAWYELMDSISSQCFYHHPAWFSAYFDRPGIRTGTHFRCAFAGDQLVAVLPLHFEQKLGGALQMAKLPDYDGLYMPDMAISDNVSAVSVWREMEASRNSEYGRHWDVFSADGVLEESAVAQTLFSAGSSIVKSSAAGRCAFVDVLDYEEVLRRLKRKFRGNLSNAKSRLSALPGVEYVAVSEPERLGPAFDEFVELELSGWKGQPDRVRRDYPPPAAIGLKRSKYLFYRNVVSTFGAFGATEIHMLRINRKAIGAQLCVILNDVCYILKTAFDEAYGRYSPGHLVLDFAIQRFADVGTAKQLCLITDYGWYRNWNPRYANYMRIKAFAKTLKARSISILYSLKS